jgi:ribosomal protein S18 acetylase RimI-like enzyme
MIGFVPVTGPRTYMLPWLLLADESEQVVLGYIDDGEMFAIHEDGTAVGVMQLIRDGDDLEIKNLAVVEGRRSRGIGREAVTFAATRARAVGASRLIVGTADSSRDAIAFYGKVGFTRYGVREGFFDSYPEEIWEDGVRARDMVMFEIAV